ncbi:MAG: MATE family efflux transporter [Stomatobaculum sp.]|nr:MATE family efflux transporter [Stomatobaculum sp.]
MDLTRGPVMKTLLRFSFPFMLSVLLQTLYSTTDTIVVGQVLGSRGLSAVSTGSQLMTMAYMICIGYANAGQVLIAQAKGAENYEKLQKSISTLFILETLLSAAIGILCIVFCDLLLSAMHTPAEAWEQARLYILICSAGVIFTGLYNMFSAILRGMGDSKHPLLFVLIASVLNIILDILFVAFFHWNVAGAALATVIGQAVSVLFSMYFLIRHRDTFQVDFRPHALRLDKSTAAQLSSIGIPMAANSAAINFSFLFVGSMVNSLGVLVSAAFGVIQKIRNFPNIITMGISQGVTPMYGQNLGAGKTDRVNETVKACLLCCSVICAAFAALFLLAPDFCFRLFTQDEEVLAYAGMSMFCLAIEMPAKALMPACSGLVNAQGFVQLSSTVALLDAFAGRVFLCWFCGFYLNLGAFGFFLGYVLGTYVTSLLVFVYYITGLWKKRAALV